VKSGIHCLTVVLTALNITHTALIFQENRNLKSVIKLTAITESWQYMANTYAISITDTAIASADQKYAYTLVHRLKTVIF